MALRTFENCRYDISPDDELFDEFILILPGELVNRIAGILKNIQDPNERRVMALCTDRFVYVSNNQLMARIRIDAEGISDTPFARELIEIASKNNAIELRIIDEFSAIFQNEKGSYYLGIDRTRDTRPIYGMDEKTSLNNLFNIFRNSIPNTAEVNIDVMEYIPDCCRKCDDLHRFLFNKGMIEIIIDAVIYPYARDVKYPPALENLTFHVPAIRIIDDEGLILKGIGEKMCYYSAPDSRMEIIYTNRVIIDGMSRKKELA